MFLIAEVFPKADSWHWEARTVTTIARYPKAVRDYIVMASEMHASAPDPGIVGSVEKSPGVPFPDPDAFWYFDWDLIRLSPEIGMAEVPRPGVVIALYGSGIGIHNAGGVAFHLKMEMSNKHPAVQAFLRSPEAQYTPTRYSTLDVFISYASEDVELAIELRNALELVPLSVFLAAKSIEGGARWELEVLKALRGSKAVAVLVTPNSIEKPWLTFEAGAAWGLDIPLFAAVQYVPPDKLPAALPAFKSSLFETSSQREAYVAALIALVTKPST